MAPRGHSRPIARSGDGTAGFAAIESPAGDDVAVARGALCSHPAAAVGQGVGKRLLLEMRQRLETAGYAWVELSVYLDHRRAAALYHRLDGRPIRPAALPPAAARPLLAAASCSGWLMSGWLMSGWFTSRWFTSRWFTFRWFTSRWFTSVVIAGAFPWRGQVAAEGVGCGVQGIDQAVGGREQDRGAAAIGRGLRLPLP